MVVAPAQRLVMMGRLLAVLVSVVLWYAPLPLARPAHQAIAIASSLIIGWITEAHDPALMGLITPSPVFASHLADRFTDRFRPRRPASLAQLPSPEPPECCPLPLDERIRLGVYQCAAPMKELREHYHRETKRGRGPA
jgi:hypothetical protein